MKKEKKIVFLISKILLKMKGGKKVLTNLKPERERTKLNKKKKKKIQVKQKQEK